MLDRSGVCCTDAKSSNASGRNVLIIALNEKTMICIALSHAQ
jgi:hypothetical protein